jgi:GGDEF domain-containing protein
MSAPSEVVAPRAGPEHLLERLVHQLARSVTGESRFAVLHVRVGGLAEVAETRGAEAVERVCRLFAKRWTGSLHATDTFAATGPDTLVVLCGDLDDRGHAMEVADAIRVAAADPVVAVAGEPTPLSLTLDVVFQDPGSAPHDGAGPYRAVSLNTVMEPTYEHTHTSSDTGLYVMPIG